MYIYAIMKTMYPPGYHHNDFVATHVLWHMIYPTVDHVCKCMSCHKTIVVVTRRLPPYLGNFY